MTINLIEKAYRTHSLTHAELVQLLRSNETDAELFSAADDVRRQYVGDAIHLRALIEFSNICRNNCLYCGLRRDNTNVDRYRMQPNDIVEAARYAAQDLGLKTVVLQSGEDLWFTTERLCNILRQIKEFGVAITLSIGEKDLEEYMAYHDAGADRFLIRIETTDKQLYHDNDPGMSWDRRAECVRNLRKAGLECGTGSLQGLPGQSIESLANDILFFKDVDADMVGIGPFIPHPDTPLKDAEGGTFDLSCKIMALTRLLLPDINIPATTAMETLTPNGQVRALQSGANVIMPNVTLLKFCKNYELYPNKSRTNNASEKEALQKLKEKIVLIGRTVGDTQGFHVRRNNITLQDRTFGHTHE